MRLLGRDAVLPLCLMATAVGFSAYLYALLADRVDDPDRARETKNLAVTSEDQFLSLEPPGFPRLQSYASIVERPLFSPSRRPTPPKPPEPAKTAPPEPPAKVRLDKGAYQLFGVIIENDRKIALIRRQGENEVQRIREGEQLTGWIVTVIEREAVEFRNGDVTDRILLRDPNAADRKTVHSNPAVRHREDIRSGQHVPSTPTPVGGTAQPTDINFRK